MNLPGKARSNMTQEQQEKAEGADKEYDNKMKQIPDKKMPTDPWGNMGESQPKGSQGPK
jgi:hypothetical protein